MRYHIDVEFVPETGSASEMLATHPQATLSWDFPVEVIARPPYKAPKTELVACHESPAFLVSSV
jgi:hypothetical protein